MVVVPAGDFMMGSPEKERGRSDEEGPQHRVTIAKPLAIGKFSITRGEFAAFVKETDHKTEEGAMSSGPEWKHQPDRSWRSPGFDQDDRHPVVCVNWHDAKEYVAWLSKKVGKAYRLLTEAEREYAARAKTATRYSFGDDDAALSEYAWYRPNSGGATHPVGEKKPNAFGLFDMHGNVWAWCEDTWHSNYHGAPNDGSAWKTGGTPFAFCAAVLGTAMQTAFAPPTASNFHLRIVTTTSAFELPERSHLLLLDFLYIAISGVQTLASSVMDTDGSAHRESARGRMIDTGQRTFEWLLRL